jgi:hypothetical protein
VRTASSIEKWLDSPGNAEPQLYKTLHHPRGNGQQKFSEQSVRELVLRWQQSGNQCPELMNEILLASRPVFSGVALSRGVCAANVDETVHLMQIRIWRKLRSFDCARGRLFTFLTVVSHQLVTEIRSSNRLHLQRFNPTGTESLDHWHSTQPEVRLDEVLNDLNWRIYGVKTTLVDEHELAGQRWLVRGLVDSQFALKRHEASDAMSIVYGIDPARSRQIHDRTLLEVRRQLLDVAEIPAVTRRDLVGTRSKALARYSAALSPGDFSTLVFLLKNLSPMAVIPKTDRVDLILDGFPGAVPLFPENAAAPSWRAFVPC